MDMSIWNILLTAALTVVGIIVRYLFLKTQDIVPEKEIRQMIADSIAPQIVKITMIYERLVHIEGKLDRLLEENRNDSGRDSHTSRT